MGNTYKLLLVEDDEFSALVTYQVLKGSYEIDIVSTGEEAVEFVGKNKYNVILLDIGLPGIGGVQTAGLIRKTKGYENTPIVALTAYAMSGDREEFLNGGCTHYLSKPFAIRELSNLVRELVTEPALNKA